MPLDDSRHARFTLRARLALRRRRLIDGLWPRSFGRSNFGGMLALAVGVLVLMILGGTAAIVLDRRGAAYDAAEQESASLAAALGEQTSRAIQAAFLDLEDVVERIQAKRVASQAELAAQMRTEEAHEVLRAGISGLSQLSSISVIGVDGQLINTSQDWPPPRINLSDREFFRTLRDDPLLDHFISAPQPSRGRGIGRVYLVRRVNAADGSFIGLVAGAIDLSYFDDFYRTVAENAGLYVALWRYDGALLASYPRKGNSLDPTRYDAEPFSASEPAPRGEPSFPGTPNGRRGVITRAVKNLPLFVTVGRTEASIAEEWRGQGVALGAGALLLLALLVAAFSALIRQIARRELIEAVLRRHRDNLEREIEQRTKALAASEARHRDVAEISSDWLWEHDAEHRFTFVSQRFGDAVGIPVEQFIGKRMDELSGFSIDRAHHERIWEAMAERRSFSGMTSRVEFDDGRVRYWRTSGKPFFDPETGQFAGYRGSGTDVTASVESEAKVVLARQRAEEAEEKARHARAKLLDAIEILPAGFALWDASDRLELCNARYREIYRKTSDLLTPGLRFDELIRAGVLRGEVIHQDNENFDHWVASRVALHRAPEGAFYQHQMSDGRWIQVDERRTADGGVVGTRVDVTEVHKREAFEHDRQKLAALGQLAGGVAHEINNLLQPAIIFPEMIAERLPETDIESREDLASILDSARKARDVVKNILRYARKEELVLEPLDMIAEVEAALAFLRDLLPRTVAFEVSIGDGSCRPMVEANKTQLTQVLTNLCVNATHAMQDRGTIAIAIAQCAPDQAEAARLEIEPGRAYMSLAVRDTGCGMDAETQARVFEPFFTTKPVGHGTGLGLSVAYGILRSWGGAIAVTSAPGQGATFTLYIPTIQSAI